MKFEADPILSGRVQTMKRILEGDGQMERRGIRDWFLGLFQDKGLEQRIEKLSQENVEAWGRVRELEKELELMKGVYYRLVGEEKG